LIRIQIFNLDPDPDRGFRPNPDQQKMKSGSKTTACNAEKLDPGATATYRTVERDNTEHFQYFLFIKKNSLTAFHTIFENIDVSTNYLQFDIKHLTDWNNGRNSKKRTMEC
jgi:hypothetical protein